MARLLSALLLVALALVSAPAPADPAVDDGRVRGCIEGLRSRWLEEREQAKQTLLQLGPAAEPRLHEALRDPDQRLRQAAAELLGHIGTPTAIAALVAALLREQGEVRLALVRALAQAGPPARAALERHAAGLAQPEEAVEQALGEFTRSEVEHALQALVTTRNVYGFYTGQFRAVLALGPRALPVLWEMFSRPDYPFADPQPHRRSILRLLAGWALVDARDPGLAPAFEQLLASDSAVAELGLERAEVEDAAVLALWHTGRTEPLDALVRRLEAVLSQEGENRSYTRARVLTLHYRTARYAPAEQHLRDLIEQEPQLADWAHYCLACVCAVQRRIPEALDHLRQAIDAGYGDAEWIRLEGDLDNLRGTPGFEELMREVDWRDRAAPRPR